mmetsp:Transcript_55904/g.154093  ORF Transcript_55904/g.154093 Transcript_55904/m.154093 type:complete len:97 (-) Transcript_55904:555-845(-)
MATKTGVRYRRVAQNEEEMEERKRKRDAAVDQISTKIQAMFWVSLAAIVVYMTDLPRTVIESEKIDRVYLNISIVCLVINSCLVFYLTVWLPYVQK